MKRILSFIVLATILLSFASCKKEVGSVVDVSASYAAINNADRIIASDLILRGKPVKINSQFMTDPDNTLDGIMNCRITEYTFLIDEVYKGEYTQSEITVRTTFGYGLTPEQILNYGTKDSNVSVSGMSKYSLELDKECIICVSYIENLYLNYDGFSGYYLMFGEAGYYLYDEESGEYQSKGVNKSVFTQDTIKQEIESVEIGETKPLMMIPEMLEKTA